MKIELSKSVKQGEEEIFELDLREPTAKDVRECGFPFNVETREIDTAKVHKYACKLAALPPSVIDQISAADFVQKVLPAVIGFFGDGQE